jgi:hypothetical protein
MIKSLLNTFSNTILLTLYETIHHDTDSNIQIIISDDFSQMHFSMSLSHPNDRFNMSDSNMESSIILTLSP